MPSLRGCSALLLALGLAACTRGESPADETTVADATTAAEATAATTEVATTGLDCAAAPSDLFTRRIAPLLASDRPKTCNTCHLSGVDLQLFVQETPCQTMACLNARGLVDLEDPASSTVLQWISRADPASPLIDQQVIDEEYAAFLAWIEASAGCGLCYTGAAPCGEPVEATCAADDPKNEDYEDPGDCSPLTRETLFRRRVYAWRDRCYPCHFDSTDFEAPKWIASGSCELGSLMTMRNIFDRGLVDLDDPAASLLLLKPLAESAGGVVHGGHDKFADVNDPAYIDFISWIQREAACAP